MNKKIALVYPYCVLNGYSEIWQLGLGYIHSYLKHQGFNVKYFHSRDYNYNSDEIIEGVKNYNPDVIGLHTNYAMREMVNDFLIKLNYKCITVVGGPDATLRPELYIDNCDYIILGEGEKIFYEFLKYNKPVKGMVYKENNKIIKTEPAELILNLDELPLQYRKNNVIDMITMRGGCPYKCKFCYPVLPEMFGKKMRYRSVENVVDEIQVIIKENKNQSLFFVDDLFTIDKNRVIKICDKIIERNLEFNWGCNSRVNTLSDNMLKKMKQAGCKIIALGIESGSNEVLNDILNKKSSIEKIENAVNMIKKNGIQVSGYIMIGSPGESLSDIKKTVKFIDKLRLDALTVTIYTLKPNTEFYYMYEQDMTDNEKLCVSTYGMDNDLSGIRFMKDENNPDKILKYKKKLFFCMIKKYFKNNNIKLLSKFISLIMLITYHIFYGKNFLIHLNFINTGDELINFIVQKKYKLHIELQKNFSLLFSKLNNFFY